MNPYCLSRMHRRDDGKGRFSVNESKLLKSFLRSSWRNAAVVLVLSVSIAHPATLADAYSHHSPTASRDRASGWAKPVYSHGYGRKDGTYVAPYNRREQRTRHNRSGLSRTARAPRTYNNPRTTTHRRIYSNSSNSHRAASAQSRDSHGRITRSAAAKNAFKRQQPCPSTGKSSGPCSGYVIDHVKPLECGGADAPSNMQWQTVADGKAKDKTERSCR